MCGICLSTPCRSGCPNETLHPVQVCEKCGDHITAGNEMWSDSCIYICEDCMSNMSAKQFAEEYAGFTRLTADLNDY